MSTGVTSDTDGAETLQLEKSVHLLHQRMKNVEAKLVNLCEKINLCNSVINDLVAVKRIVVSKSLQDVPLPQKQTEE